MIINGKSNTFRRHRLLFVIDSLTGGGAEHIICKIASRLDSDLYDVHIALTLGRSLDQLPADHVSLAILPDYVPLNFTSRRKVVSLSKWLGAILLLSTGKFPLGRHSGYCDLVADINTFSTMTCMLGQHVLTLHPDCIISFLPNSNMLSLLAKSFFKFKTSIICSDRSHLSSELPRLSWSKIRQRIIRHYYPKASAHIALTPGTATDLCDNFGVPSDLIHTISNGVDIPLIQKLGNEPISQNFDKGITNIIAIGRLSEEKGFDILLRALGRIREFPWCLNILGCGVQESALRELARQQGIADRVNFNGWVSNPYSWMKNSDLFTLTSRWEGMPNVLLEAMAIGLPCIATDCPTGPRLLLDGGHAGRLVENGSESQLADEIARLVKNPVERLRLGKLAMQRCQQYSIDKMIYSYRELIDKFIKID